VSRIGPRGVQGSTPWAVICGLICRTWLAKSITTTGRAWRNPSCRQQQRFPLWRGVIAEWPECLKGCVEAEGGHFEWLYYKWKPRTIDNKIFGSKSVCSVSRSQYACNRTYGKTRYSTAAPTSTDCGSYT
jgi:hypothetical protein